MNWEKKGWVKRPPKESALSISAKKFMIWTKKNLPSKGDFFERQIPRSRPRQKGRGDKKNTSQKKGI
jgi:hypothetical protein